MGTLINRVFHAKIGCKQRTLKEMEIWDRLSDLGGSEDGKDLIDTRGWNICIPWHTVVKQLQKLHLWSLELKRLWSLCQWNKLLLLGTQKTLFSSALGDVLVRRTCSCLKCSEVADLCKPQIKWEILSLTWSPSFQWGYWDPGVKGQVEALNLLGQVECCLP